MRERQFYSIEERIADVSLNWTTDETLRFLDRYEDMPDAIVHKVLDRLEAKQ